MLVRNDVNSPRFTALRVDEIAQAGLEKLPVEELFKLEKAGREFLGFRYTNLHIGKDAKPAVAMEWHDFIARDPFKVKVSEAGDRLEISGEHLFDHAGMHKAGDPAVETINFKSAKAANIWLEELKKLPPIDAAIKLTKALEATNTAQLEKVDLEQAKKLGSKVRAQSLVLNYGQEKTYPLREVRSFLARFEK